MANQINSLKQLRYLTALAEHGHFGRAAEACFVSQSTLSAGIKELEAQLGVTLVERTNRNVVFTGLGRSIAAKAQHVLNEAAALSELAAASGEPLTGPLRLGVIPTIAPFLLPRALPQLRKLYPKLKLYLTEDQTARLLAQLEEGHLDLVLLALPYDCGDAVTWPLFEDRFDLVCRQDHPLAQQPIIHTSDLANLPLLLLAEGHCMTDHALSACRLAQRNPSADLTATSLTTLVEMVANGLGVTLLPEMAVEAQLLKGGELVARRFSDENPFREIGLAWRPTSPRGAEFKLLGDAFIQARSASGRPRPRQAHKASMQ
ncbi:MAG TPA: hydrogen peroxide-inducible genes activator [Terriglobia bacterium]|nr:hydrogen peroxide-inducible genes activator [Terriglobia bacterium]